MIHTDRKPGVRLVTDPPKREPTLTLRIRESYADTLLLILGEHTEGSEGDVARHVTGAIQRAKRPRQVNL